MSAQYQPTGMQMQGKRNNDVYSGELTKYPLTTNNTVLICKGDTVALVGGSIVPCTANAVAGTLSANSPHGVALGFSYMSVSRGLVFSQHLSPNAITSGDISQVFVYVADNQFARFTVQANGPVVAADLGATIDLGGFGAGVATPYGISRIFADVTTINTGGGSTRSLRIVGFDETVGNVAGDAFTQLLVSWNANVYDWSFEGAH